MTDNKFWKWMPLVFGVGLASVLARGQVVTFGDAADYMARARDLLATGSYSREPFLPFLPFFRAPLYPLFVAAVWRVVPDSILAIKVAHVILFVGTCQLLYLIGVLVFKEHRTALIGSLLYALNPFALAWLGDVQSEPLFTFLMAGGLLFLLRMVLAQRTSPWDAVCTGMMFGLASLTRPTALWAGLVLSAGVVVLRVDHSPLVKLKRHVLLLIASMALTIAPWTLSNVRATGELIALTDVGGYAFYFGNHPITLGFYQGDATIQTEIIENTLQPRLAQEQIDEWQQTRGYRALPLKERERLWFQAGWDNLRAYPWLTVQLWAYKAVDFWRLWLHPRAYPHPVVILSGMLFFTLYALAGWGAFLIHQGSSGRRFLLVLAILFLTVTGIHMLTMTMLRYRLPYVEPYLSILASPAVLAATTKIATYAQFLRKKVGALKPMSLPGGDE